MSSSCLITKSIVLPATVIVIHYQLKNGKLHLPPGFWLIIFIASYSIEIMCFLKIQNLDENPPKLKASISSILQVQLDSNHEYWSLLWTGLTCLIFYLALSFTYSGFTYVPFAIYYLRNFYSALKSSGVISLMYSGQVEGFLLLMTNFDPSSDI